MSLELKGCLIRKINRGCSRKGDLVLLWDKHREPKGLHRKFDCLWRGLFRLKRYVDKIHSYCHI